MADPIFESSLKTKLNTIYCDIFQLQNKKIDKFQLCLKTVASLFPLSFMTFLNKLDVEILANVQAIFSKTWEKKFQTSAHPGPNVLKLFKGIIYEFS